jgi:ferredoxin
MQIILEGHDQPVPARDGDTILQSLLRAGVRFPFSCQAGNCGTCKCELIAGDIAELEHSETALAPWERASGLILACRSQVRGDAFVRRIDTDSKPRAGAISP